MVDIPPGGDQLRAKLPHRIHLVGIGGAHMSAIAQVLRAGGHLVSGSDLKASPVTDRLAALGIPIYLGHRPEQVHGADLVVATAAARADNPELQEAERLGIPVIARAQMIAHLMRGFQSIAVAGTHGKTTTSGLIAYLLHRAGCNPAYLIGGDIPDLGGNASPGGGPHIVVEADEYAGAFLEYAPHVAVITNVEAEHLDYYRTEAEVVAAFASFMCRVQPEGRLIVCLDSPHIRSLTAAAQTGGLPLQVREIETYALQGAADWQAENVRPNELGGHDFLVKHVGSYHGEFRLQLPGTHNVSNALAAIVVAHALTLPQAVVREAVADFRGARRRFELVGEVAGIRVIDDFAHHPTEIRATLTSARERFPGRRLVVVFQPHTYSRTHYLLEQFTTAFGEADALLVVETYVARETPDQGLSAEVLARSIVKPRADYVPTLPQAAAWLARELRAGDILLTVGAGDIGALGPMVLTQLEERGGKYGDA